MCVYRLTLTIAGAAEDKKKSSKNDQNRVRNFKKSKHHCSSETLQPQQQTIGEFLYHRMITHVVYKTKNTITSMLLTVETHCHTNTDKTLHYYE